MGLFGCSGLGADAATAHNISLAHEHAAIASGLLFLSLLVYLLGFGPRRRRRVTLVMLLALVAFHPAWTISPDLGDCGGIKRDIARLVTIIAFVALTHQIVRSVGILPLLSGPDEHGGTP